MMDLPNILLNSLAISMICLILFAASREGMILYGLSLIIEYIFHFMPKHMQGFYKPFFGCLTCMCSFWGTVYYFTIYQGSGIKEYLLLILFAGAINFILDIIIVLIQTKILIHKHETFHWTDGTD